MPHEAKQIEIVKQMDLDNLTDVMPQPSVSKLIGRFEIGDR